jgi:hypothetical protein
VFDVLGHYYAFAEHYCGGIDETVSRFSLNKLKKSELSFDNPDF